MIMTKKCPFASNLANPKQYFTIASIIYIQIPKWDKFYKSLKIKEIQEVEI